MKNWKQVLAGFSTVALLLTNVGVIAPLSVYAEEGDEVKAELSSQTLTDGDVTVKGEFPKDAKLTATSQSAEDVTVEDSQELIAAYDLKVEYTEVVKDEAGEAVKDKDGNDQTETKTYTLESGKTVTVTIKDSKLEDLTKANVYQGDNKLTDVEVKDGAVSVTSSLDKTIVLTKDKEEKPTRNSGTTIGSSVDVTDQTIKSTDEKIALKGEMPSGATVAVESKDVSNVDNHKGLLALDISIQYKEGESDKEYEPASGKTIEVTLKNDALKDVTKVNVYHYADATPSTADTVAENVEVSDSTITFNASAFSKFVVTEANTEGGDTQKTIEIGSIVLEDTKDGYLTATFKDKSGTDITKDVVAEANKVGSSLTFTWTRDDDKSVSNSALDSDPNKVNVSKDNGSQVTYTLNVKDADEVTSGADGVTSNSVKVDYYSELKNGDFEYPVINPSRSGYDSNLAGYIDYKNAAYAYVKDNVPSIVWKTTATDNKFELGQYNYGDAHKAYKDTYDNTVGEQYTELNAEAAGSTYQDVLTYGDADLSWSLLHRASNVSDGTDKMYVVLMSTVDAEKALTAFKGNEQNSLKAMMEAVLKADDGGAGVTTSYNLDSKSVGDGEHSVDVTVWKIATHTQTNGNANGITKYKSSKGNVTSGTADGINGEYSDDTGWAKYTGSYTVPEGQYLTRFFFLSAETNASRGNLLDEVSFQQEIKNNASGRIAWVGDDETTRPDPEDVKITTVVDGVTHTAKVTFRNNRWTYEFEDLPSNDENGNPIHYDIKTTVKNYTTGVDENGKVTYTYNPNVTGTIEWNDGEGKDRPDAKDVKITTVVDGKIYTATVTENEDGTWSYEFEGLPKTDKDGKPIEYKITTEVDGYTTDIDEDGTVTYTKTTDVAGGFTWVDNDNKYGIRPETVEIQLLDENGKPVTDSEGNPITTTAKADENGNYTYSFDNLPEYDEDGHKIEYNVKAIVPGYEIETKANDKGGFDITCSFDKDNDNYKKYFPAEDPYMWILVDPPVEKVIEGDEPSSDTTFTFELVPYSVELTDGTEMLVKAMPLPTSLTGGANHTVVTIQGEGQEEFGNFRFDHPGTYVYHVTERNDNSKGYTYDDATYVVTFVVKHDEVDGWTCVRTIQRNGKGEDTGICTFTNTYKAPVSNNNDNNDSKSSGKHDGGKYAKVDFYLVDDSNTQPLSSGVFALYTSAGELIGTYTTDAAGHIQFPNLKGGSYYLVQLSAPNGYELNGTRVNFTVDGTPLALMLTDKAAGAATSAVDTAATVAPSDAAAADATAAGPGTENGAAVGGATGDESNMVLYGAATGAAAILLAVWFVMNRRRANG